MKKVDQSSLKTNLYVIKVHYQDQNLQLFVINIILLLELGYKPQSICSIISLLHTMQ